jgi:hypothetical protein
MIFETAREHRQTETQQAARVQANHLVSVSPWQTRTRQAGRFQSYKKGTLMTLQNAIETAKAKAAGNAKWTRSIARAAAGLLDGSICVTLFCDGYALVTTPTGQHRVNSRCDCAAAKHGHKECVHRVAKRLVEMIEETPAVSLEQDVAATPRKNLIIEIQNVWPKTWPPLYTELLARFGKSDLNMLDDDQLRRVRLAIAM